MSVNSSWPLPWVCPMKRNPFSKQKSANDDSASHCSEAYGAFLQSWAISFNSFFAHSRGWMQALTTADMLAFPSRKAPVTLHTTAPSHSTWMRIHEFDFVLYNSNRLVFNWFKVSSGFITRPQRDVYDHKNEFMFTLRVRSLDETVHLWLDPSKWFAGDFSIQEKR